ncbi:hypothetical protein MCAV_05750 [[Mycoplasma] cavipharyngis]|uniref:OppA family ABC transporter substrate-binding lipoprotein n=1 Tax=[Mycoplasma] cavipharyngis TaxID=92757 RepID=UPI00370436A7
MNFKLKFATKKYRLLKFSLLPTLSTSLILSACSTIQPPNQRNEYIRKINQSPADNSLYNFRHDYTVVAASKTTEISLTTPNLIEFGYEGQTKLDVNGKPVAYSKYKIKFGLAKSIIVTTKDGTVKVFDSDDTTTEVDDPVANGVKILKSSNEKSVNSEAFQTAIDNAQKIQFALRNDAYWVDSQGRKTTYKVVPKDFFVKNQRQQLTDANYRHKHGGSASADETAVNKTYKDKLSSVNRFSSNSEYSNLYLIKLFDVDANALIDETQFIQKDSTTQEDVLTFLGNKSTTQTNGSSSQQPSITAKTGDFKNFLYKIILDGTYFTPAPSGYIADNVNRSPSDISGIAKSSGYYWYGSDFKDMLFAGPYYVAQSNNSLERFSINRNYFDQSFANDPKSIYSYVKTFDGSDAKVFQNNQFEEYKNGAAVSVPWSSLTETQKSEVLNSPQQFNLSYNKQPDNNSITGLLDWNATLYPNPKSKNLPFLFNNAFSLLMYGVDINKLNEGTATDLTNYWMGDGYIFRSILSSAFNYYTFNNEINSNTEFWAPLARPDALIGGNDSNVHSETKLKTLLDDFENQNSFFFYGGANGNTRFEKKYSEEKAHYQKNFNNQTIQYQASNYSALKTETKRLLDKFYDSTSGKGKSLTGADKKIKFTIPTRFTNTNAATLSALHNAVSVLNSLDNRLEIEVKRMDQQLFQSVLSSKSAFSLAGWGYDLNNYFGFLGFFFYTDTDSKLFTSLFNFADLPTSTTDNSGSQHTNQNLQTYKDKATQYPEITKLAQEFKKSQITFSNNGGAKTFEEVKKATFKDLSHYSDFAKKQVTGDTTNDEFDPIFAYSKFALEYLEKISNKQIADLNREITSLIGIGFNSNGPHSILLKPIPVLTNKKYTLPPTFNEELNMRYVKVDNDSRSS